MDFRPREHFILFAAARPRFKSPRKAHGPEAVGFFFAYSLIGKKSRKSTGLKTGSKPPDVLWCWPLPGPA
jgi:hypothetical protein